MTTVEERTRRDVFRQELATLIDVDAGLLGDGVRLTDAGLDSLGMMRLLVWLETLGVVMDTIEAGLPVTVGEVLTLLEHTASPGLSIRVTTDLDSVHRGPMAMPAVPVRRPDPLAPVLRTRSLALTPVLPDDTRFLYGLAAMPETSFRWRYRGAAPSVERFAENLWQAIVVQYVARRIEDNQPVGHVMAYGAETSMRYAYIGAVFTPEVAGTGLAAQAVSLFMRHLFHIFPLTKLYLQIPGYNWPQISSGQGDLFQIEGVLRDHVWYGGKVWDEYLCAVYAEQFREGGDA